MTEEIIKQCEQQLAGLNELADEPHFSKQRDEIVTNLKVFLIFIL